MTAFVFVPLLAIAWMIGTVVVAQAAHFFLTIVESSATGTARDLSWQGSSFRAWMRDGVQWPEEPFVDHFAKGFYLAYLIALWAGPAILLGRYMGGHTPMATVIAGTAFWLFFPIGLLSSLASESRWTPFWPGLIVAFCKRPIQTFGFYLLHAPVLAVLILTLDLVLIHTSKLAVVWGVVLSPAAVVMFFIYARLLGRLGLVVTFTRPDESAEIKPQRKRRRPVSGYDERTRMFSPTEAVPDDPPADAQPPDMPGIQTLYDGEVTGYGVDYAGTAEPIEEPKPARIVHKFDDEDDEPILMGPVAEISTDRAQVAAELAKPSDREFTLHTSTRPEEPTNPYGVETVSFLFDPKTITPWLTLTAGLMVLALLQRALDMLRPE